MPPSQSASFHAAPAPFSQLPSTTALSRHLRQCHLARGRWFGAAMLAEDLHRLIAPRFATTVAMAAFVLLVAFT